MRRITSLCLLLALTSPALAAQDCDIDGVHVNPDNGSTTQGKTGLMRCRDRDSGQPLRDQELRNGDYVGLVRSYDKGAVQREYHVNQQGNREGQSREFFPDGHLALEETYRDGKLIGSSRAWHKNGAVKRVVARSDDGRQEAKIEFNDNGQLKELKCVEQPLLGKDIDDGRYCGHGSRTPLMHELFSDKGVLRGRITVLDGRTVKHETLWDNGAPKEQLEVSKTAGWSEASLRTASCARKPAGLPQTKDASNTRNRNSTKAARWCANYAGKRGNWLLKKLFSSTARRRANSATGNGTAVPSAT